MLEKKENDITICFSIEIDDSDKTKNLNTTGYKGNELSLVQYEKNYQQRNSKYSMINSVTEIDC